MIGKTLVHLRISKNLYQSMNGEIHHESRKPRLGVIQPKGGLKNGHLQRAAKASG